VNLLGQLHQRGPAIDELSEFDAKQIALQVCVGGRLLPQTRQFRKSVFTSDLIFSGQNSTTSGLLQDRLLQPHPL
jgi:hypothetical protein